MTYSLFVMYYKKVLDGYMENMLCVKGQEGLILIEEAYGAAG